MIPESLCNRVYFSALLPEVCPVTYKGLADVLDRYGVPFSLLKGTKDIWCRDYMPLQMTDHEFVAFGYRPDYLMDTAAHRKSITVNGNQKCSDFGNSECSIFGIKTTVLLASAVQ